MNKFLNVKTLLLSLFAGFALSSCGVSHSCALSCDDGNTACVRSCHNEEVSPTKVCANEAYVAEKVEKPVLKSLCINSCYEKDCLQDCSDCQKECVQSCKEKDCFQSACNNTETVEVAEEVETVQPIAVGPCIKSCHDKDCVQICSDCKTECLKACHDKDCLQDCSDCDKGAVQTQKQTQVIRKAAVQKHQCGAACLSQRKATCHKTCTDCQTKCSKDSENCVKN